MEVIANAFSQGGIWMMAIAAVHVVTIAIIAERLYALYVQRSVNQRRVGRNFEQDIQRGQLDRVVKKAQSVSKSQPIAAVVSAGTQAAREFGGRDEIQARMDEVLTVENSRLQKRTGFLAMFGNVATLLGLLGTIIGLIQAFASIANVDAAEKAVMLTQGVSLAMNTTAYGLIVAIPALVMHSILMNRTRKLQEDLNQSAFRIFNLLNYNFDAVNVKARRPKRTTAELNA